MWWQAVCQRLSYYAMLMRWDKPIGILLLLWPTLWALWLAARGVPDVWRLGIFCAGVVVMRSAGCIINDIADRQIDPHVARTRARPLAAGVVSLKEAVILLVVLLGLGLCLLLQLNRLTICCGFISLFFIILYPFAKRYTYFPQVVLGIAFYTSIPMAFAATLNHFTPLMWWVYLTAGLWTVIYDTFYAMADREEDKLIGVRSTAILFGRYDRVILAGLQVIFIGLLYYIGRLAQLHTVYNVSIIVASLLSLHHQILIRNQNPTLCFRAFLHSHRIGLVIFLGLFFDFLG